MADPLVHRFLAYLDASPSPFHAARTAARHLEEAGFTALDERAAPDQVGAGLPMMLMWCSPLLSCWDRTRGLI